MVCLVSLGDYKLLLSCLFIAKAILLHGEGPRDKTQAECLRNSEERAIVHARRNVSGIINSFLFPIEQRKLGPEREEHNPSITRHCVEAQAVDIHLQKQKTFDFSAR